MKRKAWLIAVSVFAAFVAPTSAAHADDMTRRAEQIRYAEESMLLGNREFAERKADFLAAGCGPRGQCTKPAPYEAFDWDTDSCSWPTPDSWRRLFHPACQQHDFGYRNFGKGLTLGRDEATRRWIDDRFAVEMKAICNYRFSDWTQYANLQACFKEADGMYGAVRVLSNWNQ
ncbi:phospholipase A2 [Actinoplanes sp. NPDC000266]